MSRDIVLFNSKEKIYSVAEMDESQLEPTDFCRILEDASEMIIKNGNRRRLLGDTYTIEFVIHKKELTNIMLHVQGENALSILIKLAKKHHWQIYDSAIDGMVDLNDPEPI